MTSYVHRITVERLKQKGMNVCLIVTLEGVFVDIKCFKYFSIVYYFLLFPHL